MRSLRISRQSITLIVLSSLMLAASSTFAQSSGAGADSDLLATLYDLMYGPAGLIVGLVLVLIAGYETMQRDMKAGLGVVCIIIFLWFSPAILKYFQNKGKATTTGAISQPVVIGSAISKPSASESV